MMRKDLNSLYLHFPFCRHLCNYCDFYKKVPVEGDVNQFHSFLTASWEAHQPWIESMGYQWQPLQTFYLGGGTPSLWGRTGAEFLSDFFVSRGLKLDAQGEHTMEVNPGTYTSNGIKAWKSLGINRFSLGLQSLNGNFLKFLDRVHSIEDSFQALEFFSSLENEFSVDFMLGLPFSSRQGRDVLKELECVLQYSPSHISLYILTTKGAYPFRSDLPDEIWIEREYLEVSEFLKDRGFDHYEVSNFALPGFESRHNLRYWSSQTVAALGRSATGLLAEEKIRYKWKVGESEWSEELLDEKALNLERLYMGLRICRGLELSQVFSSEDLPAVTEIALSWESRGLGSYQDGVVHLNSAGFLVLDGLVGELLRYVKSF